MGSHPAQFFVNLFLYYYENKWINKIKKTDIGRPRRFGNVFRFIGDMTALNDCGDFERNFHEIYSSELELKKKNLGYLEGEFLDLMITIKDKKLSTSSLIRETHASPR